METYYQSPYIEEQGVSDQYKLNSNELLAEFGDWKVLYFEENEQEGWQSIFCQKR
jgi:tellurite methyltransferase